MAVEVTTIVSRPDVQRVGLEYANLVNGRGHFVQVSFPNAEGFPRAAQASELVNDNTANVIFLLSVDLFDFKNRTGKGQSLELETLRLAIKKSRSDPTLNIFLIVPNDETHEAVQKYSWINNRQWLRDNPGTRENVLRVIGELKGSRSYEASVTGFKYVESIISQLEPASKIEKIASEKSSADRVSYEIFRCEHKVRRDSAFYIHLHRGITISATAAHLKANHPDVFDAPGKMIILGVEAGVVRPEVRLDNVAAAFNCNSVKYLEQLISDLVSDESVDPEGMTQYVARTFIEPQVKENNDQYPSDFSVIRAWLSSPHPGAIVLAGQGGIGKTWTMLNLRQAVTSGAAKFIRDIPRKVIFISSTDVKHSLAKRLTQGRPFTLYDLYAASELAGVHQSTSLMPNELFYNALELGNLIVFIDGLDEIIARYRSSFDPVAFFNDIVGRFDFELDAKVVITCRTLFFDQDDFRVPADIRVFDLLAFDEKRRNEFFLETFAELPRRFERAKNMSEDLAKLPSGLFVPFVLDLIRDQVLRETDDPGASNTEPYHSEILHLDDEKFNLDRIVGRFCKRESDKINDSITALTVDQQVNVLCKLARAIEENGGGINKTILELIFSDILKRKDVNSVTEQFIQHPLLSQESYRDHSQIEFRFDFMLEYFSVIDLSRVVAQANDITKSDVLLLGKYAIANTDSARNLVSRLQDVDFDDYVLRLVEILEAGREIILETCPPEDHDISDPESLMAKLSYAIISVAAVRLERDGKFSRESLSKVVVDIFSQDGFVRGVAMLDRFVRDGEPMRLDLRGQRLSNCLFRAVDIWNFIYDDVTMFCNCRFLDCEGPFSRASEMHLATFQEGCQFDDVFERVFARGNRRLVASNEQVFSSIKSFIEDLYKQARFRSVSKENLERFYGYSNNSVPFRKLYRAMKHAGIIDEQDQGLYVDVSISIGARGEAEKLITQSQLTGRFVRLANELINTAN